jgi:glycosyltransferase involved in cell wall biosynthesis
VRIGLATPGFSADAGDWCIPALRDLVQRLASTDEVRVLALRYPYGARRYQLFGAEVVALGGGERSRWHSGALWRRALAELGVEHRRLRFDVLHAFWATESGMLTAVAGRLLGVPTVVSLAGGELVGLRDIAYGDQLVALERLKVRVALGMASSITAGSRQLLEQAAPWLRSRPPEQVRWAPLGVDTDRFRPSEEASPGGPHRLIHVASLVPVKDQASLLLAASRLRIRGSTFALEVVGQGPQERGLRALATRLGLDGAVRFRGALPHEELPAVYRPGTAFVLSSRHEAQAMVALEAAASGLPVVGTAVGVVPELAPEAGIAVTVGDASALAEAVANLEDDVTRRCSMGQAARARVEADYELGVCVERFRELYASLL